MAVSLAAGLTRPLGDDGARHLRRRCTQQDRRECHRHHRGHGDFGYIGAAKSRYRANYTLVTHMTHQAGSRITLATWLVQLRALARTWSAWRS